MFGRSIRRSCMLSTNLFKSRALWLIRLFGCSGTNAYQGNKTRPISTAQATIRMFGILDVEKIQYIGLSCGYDPQIGGKVSSLSSCLSHQVFARLIWAYAVSMVLRAVRLVAIATIAINRSPMIIRVRAWPPLNF